MLGPLAILLGASLEAGEACGERSPRTRDGLWCQLCLCCACDRGAVCPHGTTLPRALAAPGRCWQCPQEPPPLPTQPKASAASCCPGQRKQREEFSGFRACHLPATSLLVPSRGLSGRTDSACTHRVPVPVQKKLQVAGAFTAWVAALDTWSLSPECS